MKRAQNIDAMVRAVKRAGLTVVSDGAVAVPIPPNLRGALVVDPDNVLLTLFELMRRLCAADASTVGVSRWALAGC